MEIYFEYKLIYTKVFVDGEGKTSESTTFPNISYLISKFNPSRNRGGYAEDENYKHEKLIRHFLTIHSAADINGNHNSAQSVELPVPITDLKTFLEEISRIKK